jgi:hypothetical protein
LIDYENIYMLLEKITDKFSDDEIISHHATAQTLLDLCRGKLNWTNLIEDEKKLLTGNRIIHNEMHCVKAVFTKNLIHYIQKGKITITHSFKYQDMGKIIASREHIFVNDVNVRKLLRDLGELILWNSEQKNFDMGSLIQLVETSNRQKRVVRIVERGVTRVTEPNVSMVLKSAELILLMSGIVNILNCKGSQKWEGWSGVMKISYIWQLFP